MDARVNLHRSLRHAWAASMLSNLFIATGDAGDESAARRDDVHMRMKGEPHIRSTTVRPKRAPRCFGSPRPGILAVVGDGIRRTSARFSGCHRPSARALGAGAAGTSDRPARNVS
jgi:hypothetical protein